MKTFVYQGFNGEGVRTKGLIEAADLKDARDKLSQGGVFPEEVKAASDSATDSRRRRGRRSLNTTDNRAEFYRALATLLKAGIPIEASLDLLLQQPSGDAWQAAGDIAGIRDRIRDGSRLSDAMTQTGISVGMFETAVLESGEETGDMAEVLNQVAEYLEDVVDINQSLKTACIYPAVIVATALVVATGVLGFLVPQLARVFEQAGMELPAITTAVTAVSRYFLPVVLPAILAAVIAGVAGWRRAMADDAKRVAVEKGLMRVPGIRTGFRLLVTARFARTLSMLLNGGLSVIDAFLLSARSTGSAWVTAAANAEAEEVRHGKAFHQSVSVVPLLGPLLASWARAGEAAGNLSGLMAHAAGRYQHLWKQYVRRAMSIIEPVLIVLVAVFVLIVALAILLPILSLNQQVGG